MEALAFALPRKVLVRPVSARYAACLRSDASAVIDVARARAQHAAYVDAIRALGVEVAFVSADDESPDACFVEDTAVVTGPRRAVATRPGAPSRRDEVYAVSAALARELDVHVMDAPATLDGGDVLRVGRRLFVGLSERTNAEGAAALAEVAARDGLEVTTLAVRGGLHLKSACTLAGPDLLLFDPALVTESDLTTLRAAGIATRAVLEPVGANVLALGDAVLVSAAAPRTAQALRDEGRDVRVVDVSEMHKGDGALTCLSLRIPRAGAWST
jgi:dimethylargininase